MGLTAAEWGLLREGDDTQIDFNGDSSVTFMEFMAARSGALAALSVSSSDQVEDLLSSIGRSETRHLAYQDTLSDTF